MWYDACFAALAKLPRQAVKQLEATVEESILREERALNGEIEALDAVKERDILPSDVQELHGMCAALTVRFIRRLSPSGVRFTDETVE